MFVLRKWKHTYALWYLYVVFQPILMEQGHYAVDRVILNFNLFLFVFKNLRTLFCKKYHWSCCHSEFALIALNNRSKWPSCKAIKRLLFKFASIEFEWMRYVSLFSIIVCIFNLIIIIANKRPFCALQFIQKKKRKNANIEHHIDWERKRNDIFSPNHYTQQHTIWITKKTLFIVYLKEKEDEAILFIFSDFSLECIFCTQITHTSTTHNRNCIFFSFVSQQQCVLIWLSLEYGNAFFYSFAIGFWFITCMYYVVATVCCFFAIYRPFTVLIFRFLAISFIVFRMHITIYLLLHKSFFFFLVTAFIHNNNFFSSISSRLISYEPFTLY